MNRIQLVILVGIVLLFSGFKIYQEFNLDQLRQRYSSGDYSQWPQPHLDKGVEKDFKDIGSLPKTQYPKDNTYNKEKEKLGKTLFFDPRLSGSGQIACASCHDSELGWGDGRRVSYGHNRQLGKRNAMTLLNVGLADSLFWDGRSVSLEEQAGFPVEDSLEMHSPLNLAVERIAAIKGYENLFLEAFGSPEINEERIRKAMATFERGIVSESTKFDRFIAGESDIYSDDEVLGLHLFRTKARCINCHNTGYFSDNEFHNTGLNYYGRRFEDLGLFEVTGKKEDVGKFKTSTLREISRTGPYMHNGLFPHLEGVVNMYDAGMFQPKRKKSQLKDSLFPITSSLIKKLDLSDREKKALVAFLKSLESRNKRENPPVLPE